MAGQPVYRTGQNLRPRIFRASREGDLTRVSSRPRLLRRCRANVCASVRRVTPGHQGQGPPGVDQPRVTTPAARGPLCALRSHLTRPRVPPVRRVSIPTRHGTRPRGLPTIVERGVQAMGKNALAPCWEARGEGSRDGFRPGRGCQEARATLVRVARPHTTRPWGRDADSAGALPTIGPAALVQASGHVPARALRKQWLNAGDVEDARRHPTETGVPPGGVVSPVWWNVALHGMAHARGISSTPQGVRRGTEAWVRDADDLAVLGPTPAKAIEAQERLRAWRRDRGRRLADEPTHRRHVPDGCNGLAFNSRHAPAPNRSRSGHTRRITPRPDARNDVKRQLKGPWRQHGGRLRWP
jgi:RNA-directed DNA polymerase